MEHRDTEHECDTDGIPQRRPRPRAQALYPESMRRNTLVGFAPAYDGEARR